MTRRPIRSDREVVEKSPVANMAPDAGRISVAGVPNCVTNVYLGVCGGNGTEGDCNCYLFAYAVIFSLMLSSFCLCCHLPAYAVIFRGKLPTDLWCEAKSIGHDTLNFLDHCRTRLPTAPARKMPQSAKILLISLPSLGQLNVQLSTAYALLTLHPEIEVHLASYSSGRNHVAKISDMALKACPPGRKPLIFHALGGTSHEDAQKPLNEEHSLINGPGFWGMWPRVPHLITLACPWNGPDFVSAYVGVCDVLDEVRADVVAVDPIFGPALTAVRDRKENYHILSPVGFKDNVINLDLFWKIPWYVFRLAYWPLLMNQRRHWLSVPGAVASRARQCGLLSPVRHREQDEPAPQRHEGFLPRGLWKRPHHVSGRDFHGYSAWNEDSLPYASRHGVSSPSCRPPGRVRTHHQACA